MATLQPESIEVLILSEAAEEAERWSAIDQTLSGDAELLLLGVRLPPDEYQRFKDSCLARKKPFVRLPGSFSPAAIAHQISRQVGWRLRDQSPGGSAEGAGDVKGENTVEHTTGENGVSD